MPTFVQQFRFEGKLFAFRFYKLDALQGFRYSIAFDLENTVQRFEMNREGGDAEWKIVTPNAMPKWINNAEDQFSKAIGLHE